MSAVGKASPKKTKNRLQGDEAALIADRGYGIVTTLNPPLPLHFLAEVPRVHDDR